MTYIYLRAALVVVAMVTASVTHAAVARADLQAAPTSLWVAPEVQINRPAPVMASDMMTLASARDVARLMRLNIRIWECVGWQAGRYIAIRRQGVDVGDCPNGLRFRAIR